MIWIIVGVFLLLFLFAVLGSMIYFLLREIEIYEDLSHELDDDLHEAIKHLKIIHESGSVSATAWNRSKKFLVDMEAKWVKWEF